jgi:predicted ATPase
VSLPLAPTRLLGRDEDVKTLHQWLADSSARLITLTGPGGAGKTRLALEIARQISSDGAARVLFVPLAAIRDAAFVASAIAEALGLLDNTAVDLARRARASCDGTPTWLVLDNFEQVLDAGPLVAELLSSVAALRVLVTSRAPLRVRGEREFGVGPLALDVGADAASPGDPASSPAVRLFVDRVRDVQPGFQLTPANIATVTAICRRLDALPLALELAAPWLKVLSPEDLLLRLAEDAPLSTIAPRDLPERQQTMNATVAWSYQLLDPGEQRVFRRLGVLPGRFSIEAAAAVVAEDERPSPDLVLAAAADLIDKSLLLRAETSLTTRPLYRMLETVRAYAALELDAAGERGHAMEGLARHCVNEAQAAAIGMSGAAQGEWLDCVRDDLDTYRRTMAWLIEQRRPAEATAIVYGLLNFWVIRGHTTEGLDLCERTLALTPLAPEVECRGLVAAASLQYVQGKLDGARRALERCLAFEHGEAAAVFPMPRGVPGPAEDLAHRQCVERHGMGRIGDRGPRPSRPSAGRSDLRASGLRIVVPVAEPARSRHPRSASRQCRRGHRPRAREPVPHPAPARHLRVRVRAGSPGDCGVAERRSCLGRTDSGRSRRHHRPDWRDGGRQVHR